VRRGGSSAARHLIHIDIAYLIKPDRPTDRQTDRQTDQTDRPDRPDRQALQKLH